MSQRAQEEEALRECQRWVEGWVVGERLCPFARPAIEAGEVAYRCLTEDDEAPLIAALIEAAICCLEEGQTMLLILTARKWQAFSHYLELLKHAESALEQERIEVEVEVEDQTKATLEEVSLGEQVQLASFHPGYLFADEAPDSTSHYSNRSPWPILHLLPEYLIDATLPEGSDPLKIPERNIAHLEALGLGEVLRRLRTLRVG
ncbi:MAG: DUF1415 family protein [Myxococcota bacterium]|nr:DUF1415 family protein [Myxococcota bacterium]